jgi:hypothetical protein
MIDNLPNETDELFREEIDQEYGAWLKNPSNKFFLYSEGYREAGDKLYELCLERRFNWNTIIYPLVFCFRQYCELKLKELIIMGYEYIDERKDFRDEHNLLNLWKVYRTEILPKIEEIDKKTLRNVERVISQFNSEDPNSMNYRYPLTKGPNRRASLSRTTLDVKNFKEVMDRLILFFDWQWDMLSHYSEMKSEMFSDVLLDMHNKMQDFGY